MSFACDGTKGWGVEGVEEDLAMPASEDARGPKAWAPCDPSDALLLGLESNLKEVAGVQLGLAALKTILLPG